MQEIVTTHKNADFDALASAVAATFLYPGSVAVLPGSLNPNVREFFAVHRDLFRSVTRSRADLSEVRRLVVVDANNWSRLDRMNELKDRPGLTVHLWDHHMTGCDIEASFERREETGAAVTLLVGEIRKRDIPFAPMQATLFLLGIHEDTGNLTFPSTRPEDVMACAFLMENGADLNVAGAFLSQSFDAMHQDLLTRMLAEGRTVSYGGFNVGITIEPAESRLTMLGQVVSKYLEIVNADAVFSVFPLDKGKSMVIARGGYSGLDVGRVVRALSGGGHPGAGSAMVRDMAPAALAEKIAALIQGGAAEEVRVGAIMSAPGRMLSPEVPMGEACRLLARERARAALVVEEGRAKGLVSEAECAKVRTPSQEKAPAKAFMRKNLPQVLVDEGVRSATRLMMEGDHPLLPVVEEEGGEVKGMLTRADILLQMYSF